MKNKLCSGIIAPYIRQIINIFDRKKIYFQNEQIGCVCILHELLLFFFSLLLFSDMLLIFLVCLFRLLKNFRSDSAVHKELLAVLAAITEVIKERGGTESSTEYFAALVHFFLPILFQLYV